MKADDHRLKIHKINPSINNQKETTTKKIRAKKNNVYAINNGKVIAPFSVQPMFHLIEAINASHARELDLI